MRNDASQAYRVIAVVRALGVLLGLFLVFTTIADISGLIPHSIETPPLRSRAIHAAPALIAGIVLLFPFRLINSGNVFVCLAAAYAGLSLIAVAKAAFGIRDYLAGELHWAAVPTALVLVAIVLGNALALRSTWLNQRPQLKTQSVI